MKRMTLEHRNTKALTVIPGTCINEAGIFDAGFGEILRSPLLQWAEKLKFPSHSHKLGVTDLSLVY